MWRHGEEEIGHFKVRFDIMDILCVCARVCEFVELGRGK
jgi:hypothetical protein